MPKSHKPTLRIGKLPDLTPVKMTVSLDREVHELLEDYARIYGESYGEAVKPADLVPFMVSLNSLEVVASLIKNENDSLWPVLEKLEDELSKHKKRQNKLSRYLNKN